MPLGLLLPTLLVWRAHLAVAHEWAERRQHGPGGGGGLEVAHSTCGRLCRPALRAAATCPGRWAGAAAITALAPFIVAALW